MKKEYFFIDINIKSLKIIKQGKTTSANLTGDTGEKNIHRTYLTKGQYNKLITKLS